MNTEPEYEYNKGDIVTFKAMKSEVCGMSVKPLATATKVYIIKTPDGFTTAYESELRKS